MNTWLDFTLVGLVVVASLIYAIYALGPRRIKDAYSRFATKHFGLRAARWFTGTEENCNNCSSNPNQEKKIT